MTIDDIFDVSQSGIMPFWLKGTLPEIFVRNQLAVNALLVLVLARCWYSGSGFDQNLVSIRALVKTWSYLRVGGEAVFVSHWWRSSLCFALVEKQSLSRVGGEAVFVSRWWSSSLCCA